MKLDLPVSENWEQLNDEVKRVLGLSPALTVRVFKDLSSAVLELAQGTAQFFSHKKSLAFVKGQTAAFDFLLPHFYKEAFQIKHTSHLDIKDIKEWVEALNKDTSFVLFAEDHPVTGEIYSFCDELDRLLNEKRIFSLRVSHARYSYENLEVRPYSVRLCSWAADLTIAVCGERFRSPPMVVHRQTWNAAQILEQIQSLQKSRVADANLITDFERILQERCPQVQAWFQSGQPRLHDRAILIFKNVSGEALRTQILAHSSLQGLADKIETTNMCRWGATRLYQNWWEPVPQNEVLRSLVLFDASVLSVKGFADLVISSYEEVQKLQVW